MSARPLEELTARIAPAGIVRVDLRGDDTRCVAFGDVQIDDRFEIGSVTKVFTAALLEDLVDEGVVSLDEPVTACLGEDWRAGKHVTLERLARHRSGLPRLPRKVWAGILRDPDDPYRGLTVDDLRASLPLRIPRGRWFRYSNFGFALLGVALQARTGKPWPTLVREYITNSLEMHHTGIDGPVVQPHSKKGKPVAPWTLSALEPAGGVRSTAADLAKFMRGRTPGLGWMRDNGVRWHNGATGGTSSFVGWSDDMQKGLILLANAQVADSLSTAGQGLLQS